METNAAERILKYLEYKGISKTAFYRETGLSNGFLDKSANIRSDKIDIILNKYRDINLLWLITGEGEMLNRAKSYKESNTSGIVAEPAPEYGKSKGIPLIPATAMAGFGNGELQIHEKDIEEYINVQMFKNANYCIQVEGRSMENTFFHGDIIPCLWKTKDSFIQWNEAYVLDTTQGILVKRIRKGNSPSTWILRSDNPDYDDILVNSEEDVRNIALVLGVIGKR